MSLTSALRSILISLFALAALPASAAVINVAVGESIQAAYNGASCGDTITLAPGTYYERLTFTKACGSGTPLVINCGGADHTCKLNGQRENTECGLTLEDYAQPNTESNWTQLAGDAAKGIWRTTCTDWPNGTRHGRYFNQNNEYRFIAVVSDSNIVTSGSASDSDSNGVPDDEQCGTTAGDRCTTAHYEGPSSRVIGGRLVVRLKRTYIHATNWANEGFTTDLVPGSSGSNGALIAMVATGIGVNFSGADWHTWDGIDIEYFDILVNSTSASNQITIKSMELGAAARYQTRNRADNLTYDDVLCDGHVPNWMARDYVKSSGSPNPGNDMQGDCWHQDAPQGRTLTIKNSVCQNVFDCIVANDSTEPNNFTFENNTLTNIRDDVMQMANGEGPGNGTWIIRDNTCVGCTGFMGPYFGSASTTGETYVYRNILDSRPAQQFGVPTGGPGPDWTASTSGKRSALACEIDNGVCTGRPFQTHSGAHGGSFKFYQNTIYGNSDWWTQGIGGGIGPFHGANTTSNRTYWLNNVFVGNVRRMLFNAGHACENHFDGNIYYREGVNEASSCSGETCILADGHGGGFTGTWQAWCGQSDDTPCGATGGSGPRDLNCTGGDYTGDWDVNSRNANPGIDENAGYRPFAGSAAASGGVDVPDSWLEGNLYQANSFVGAVSPNAAPPDTWDVTSFTLSSTSCTVGVDCDATEFTVTATASGTETTGAISWEMDCDTTGGYTAESPNPLSAESTASVSAAGPMCDMSGETSARTITVEIRSLRNGLTGSKTATFQVLVAGGEQSEFAQFGSGGGSSNSTCNVNALVKPALDDTDGSPASPTDGWYSDTCTGTSDCCEQGSLGVATCNATSQRVELQSSSALSQPPTGDQEILIRVRDCDGVGSATLTWGFWDGAAFYCSCSVSDLTASFETRTCTLDWETCGTIDADHNDGSGVEIRYDCNGCDSSSFAWRANIPDPSPPEVPGVPVLVPTSGGGSGSVGSGVAP